MRVTVWVRRAPPPVQPAEFNTRVPPYTAMSSWPRIRNGTGRGNWLAKSPLLVDTSCTAKPVVPVRALAGQEERCGCGARCRAGLSERIGRSVGVESGFRSGRPAGSVGPYDRDCQLGAGAGARFVGSPTILINGLDPFGAARQSPAYACRVYATPAGLSRVPPLGDVISALTAASNREPASPE